MDWYHPSAKEFLFQMNKKWNNEKYMPNVAREYTESAADSNRLDSMRFNEGGLAGRRRSWAIISADVFLISLAGIWVL